MGGIKGLGLLHRDYIGFFFTGTCGDCSGFRVLHREGFRVV